MGRSHRIGLLGVVCALAASLLACVPFRGGWDPALVTPYTETSGRLADLAPHFLPDSAFAPAPPDPADPGGATLFLCRWETDRPIPVHFPADASEPEVEILRIALAAWENGGLGVRFVEADVGAPISARREGIAFRFVSQGDPGQLPAGAGDTITDCRIDGPAGGDRVPARLVSASIWLRRDAIDLLGRAVPITAEERLGAALHELGHALGYSSHAAAGSTIMRASPEVARKAGRRVGEGEVSVDATLAALYAVPNGLIVGRLVLPSATAEAFERLTRAARAADHDGPFTRVGDRGARFFFRNARTVPVALSIRPWPVDDPEDIQGVPNPPARLLLEAEEAPR